MSDHPSNQSKSLRENGSRLAYVLESMHHTCIERRKKVLSSKVDLDFCITPSCFSLTAIMHVNNKGSFHGVFSGNHPGSS